jgi:hypothetical protein
MLDKNKEHLSEGQALRHRFWIELLRRAEGKTKLREHVLPGHSNTLSAGAGKSGLQFKYDIAKDEAWVALCIDCGRNGKEETKAIFDHLQSSKKEIERDFGGPLVWWHKEGRRRCDIQSRIKSLGYLNQAEWGEIQDALIEAMVRLEKAAKPQIDKLQL